MSGFLIQWYDGPTGTREPRRLVTITHSSSGLDTPLQSVASHPLAIESTPESSATTSESPELSDESSESVTASPQPVSRSPGAGLGLDVVAAPFPPPEASEVEPEDVASA